jgi:hypothetical protein
MNIANLNKIEIQVDGYGYTLSPVGRQYSESNELITREDRAASGKLRRDIIANKKTFTLKYDTIGSGSLEQIETIYKNHKDSVMALSVSKVTSSGKNKIETYEVLMRPYSIKRFTKSLWEGVTLEFVEV